MKWEIIQVDNPVARKTKTKHKGLQENNERKCDIKVPNKYLNNGNRIPRLARILKQKLSGMRSWDENKTSVSFYND